MGVGLLLLTKDVVKSGVLLPQSACLYTSILGPLILGHGPTVLLVTKLLCHVTCFLMCDVLTHAHEARDYLLYPYYLSFYDVLRGSIRF